MDLQSQITAWIENYAHRANMKTLVVGISGGIDSAVVSTLCARTNRDVIVVTMPIRQRPDLHDLSLRHGRWLTDRFPNVHHETINLTSVFDEFEERMDTCVGTYNSLLGFANSRSRLRMITLYQIAQSTAGLVVGTGNKVEDFGVGFYTKYGDGGVDISPIADCYKTEVWQMGRDLNIIQDIIDAPPTDGLWDDGRTDEDQLGLSYAEMEVAMKMALSEIEPSNEAKLLANMNKFLALHARNSHKMNPIPVFKKS